MLEHSVKARGDEAIHRLAQQLGLRPSEEHLDITIQGDHVALLVDDDSGVGGGVE
jgi:hypothetical protein